MIQSATELNFSSENFHSSRIESPLELEANPQIPVFPPRFLTKNSVFFAMRYHVLNAIFCALVTVLPAGSVYLHLKHEGNVLLSFPGHLNARS